MRDRRLKGVNENSKYSICFFVLLPWYVRGLSNLVLELRHVEDHHRSYRAVRTYVAQSWRAHLIGTFERMDGRAKLYPLISLFIGLLLCYK